MTCQWIKYAEVNNKCQFLLTGKFLARPISMQNMNWNQPAVLEIDGVGSYVPLLKIVVTLLCKTNIMLQTQDNLDDKNFLSILKLITNRKRKRIHSTHMQRGNIFCLETAKRLPSFIFEAWKFPNQKKEYFAFICWFVFFFIDVIHYCFFFSSGILIVS